MRLADGEELGAPAVVVATDGTAAARLLAGLDPPAWRSVTTLYHSAPARPAEAILHLDADHSDLVANSVVMSAVAARHAPPGRSLVSTSVVGPRQDDPHLERRIRERLAAMHGGAAGEFELIARYRIDRAQPAVPPPLVRRRAVRLGSGRYVCGDWRDTPSIQGALVSGRRAADAVLADST